MLHARDGDPVCVNRAVDEFLVVVGAGYEFADVWMHTVLADQHTRSGSAGSLRCDLFPGVAAADGDAAVCEHLLEGLQPIVGVVDEFAAGC